MAIVPGALKQELIQLFVPGYPKNLARVNTVRNTAGLYLQGWDENGVHVRGTRPGSGHVIGLEFQFGINDHFAYGVQVAVLRTEMIDQVVYNPLGYSNYKTVPSVLRGYIADVQGRFGHNTWLSWSEVHAHFPTAQDFVKWLGSCVARTDNGRGQLNPCRQCSHQLKCLTEGAAAHVV